MDLERISSLFNQVHTVPIGSSTTIKSVLTSLAQRLSNSETKKSLSPRHIQACWSFILHACAEENVTPSGVETTVNIYEKMYPSTILDLYGIIPYVLESWKIVHNVKDAVMMREHLAAISIVALDKMSRGIL